MTNREKLPMGRKAESIYTAAGKNHREREKKEVILAACHSISSFAEHMKRNAAAKACYVCISGITMPVLSA